MPPAAYAGQQPPVAVVLPADAQAQSILPADAVSKRDAVLM